jgi:hypothetical protein
VRECLPQGAIWFNTTMTRALLCRCAGPGNDEIRPDVPKEHLDGPEGKDLDSQLYRAPRRTGVRRGRSSDAARSNRQQFHFHAPSRVADFNRDSSEIAKAFSTKYEAAYKIAPDLQSSWPYDAVHVLGRAIDAAKSLEPEKLRQAILSVKGYAGAEGIYNFDKNGDGLHGYNIVKNNNGTIVFDKHIDFDD